MKMAEILVKQGIRVILLGRGDQLLGRGAHPAAAAHLQHYLEGHGVDIRLGCTLERMEEAGERAVCQLSGGVIEETDIVLVCMGVRPNLAFVDRDQVKVDTAVSPRCAVRSSIP